MATADGAGWIRTIIGAISAVAVSLGGVYTVIIVPQDKRITNLEASREDDRKRLTDLYVSIQTNNEYKIFAQSERNSLRRDQDKSDARLLRIEEEQNRRTGSVALLNMLDKRVDRLSERLDETERRFTSSYTLSDEVKNLRGALESLRQRVMVPVGTK